MPWIIAGGAVAGGTLNAITAGKAGKGQAEAANAAIGESRRQYDQTRADTQSQIQLGTAASRKIGDLLGLGTNMYQDPRYTSIYDRLVGAVDEDHKAKYGMSIFDARAGGSGNLQPAEQKRIEDLAAAEYRTLPQQPGMTPTQVMEMDPGYQFRLDEGLKAGRNIAGARGMLNSGATAKALTRYGQDYASGEFNNIFNRLAGSAGIGQNATALNANAGAANAANVGNLLTGAANARGASAIAGANAIGGAFNTVGNYYGQQNTLDKILASRGGGGVSPSWLNTYAPS